MYICDGSKIRLLIAARLREAPSWHRWKLRRPPPPGADSNKNAVTKGGIRGGPWEQVGSVVGEGGRPKCDGNGEVGKAGGEGYIPRIGWLVKESGSMIPAFTVKKATLLFSPRKC